MSLYLESVLGVKLYVLDFFVVIFFYLLKFFRFKKIWFLIQHGKIVSINPSYKAVVYKQFSVSYFVGKRRLLRGYISNYICDVHKGKYGSRLNYNFIFQNCNFVFSWKLSTKTIQPQTPLLRLPKLSQKSVELSFPGKINRARPQISPTI